MAAPASDRMLALVEAIHPLRRMINSPGLDEAFRVVRREVPSLRIHEYRPGEAADDWTVPASWELVSASLKDAEGRVLASDADSHLFVAAYSEPVHGRFTKAEIAGHMRCHPVLPDAFFMEHRNAYNYALTDWGITLPQNLWNALPDDGLYEVEIVVRRDSDRTMKVGEVFVEGASDRIVCFTAHIDELCNDNLSSCAVLIEFFRELATRRPEDLRYSYQLLLIPETIGTFFYLRNNEAKRERTVGMVNLETVGRGEEWVIKQSLHPPRYVDRLMQVAGAEVLGEYRTIDFFDGYGNEERVFEYPTIGIPSVALQRYPFDEYHSSDDTPDRLSADHLMTALAFVRRLHSLIEGDLVPEYRQLLPPWLTKHGLYYDSKDQPELFRRFMNQVQFSIDGRTSLVEMCHRHDIPFEALAEYVGRFIDRGFIEARSTGPLWRTPRPPAGGSRA